MGLISNYDYALFIALFKKFVNTWRFFWSIYILPLELILPKKSNFDQSLPSH